MTIKDKFTCPKCGSRSMIKINDKNETYMLKCEECKEQVGPLPVRDSKESLS